MKEIYLIRHGQTDYNVEKRVQGKGIDASLNETGIYQGDAFYNYYRNHGFDLVISSSLKRTMETVRQFIDEKNIPYFRTDEIDEISWGIYEGQPATEEMQKEHRLVLDHWQNGFYDAKIKEGESALELEQRLQKFIVALQNRPEKKILICSHGGTLAFLMTLLQEQALSMMPNYKHSNTGLCKFIYDGQKFHLSALDDLKHLEPAQ